MAYYAPFHSMINCIYRFRVALLLGAFVLLTQNSFAQSEGELTYKFTVEGVTDKSEAKLVQHGFLQESYTVSCVFIDECSCFKLTSSEALSYEFLRTLLANNGFELSTKVMVSDGTILTTSSNHLNESE